MITLNPFEQEYVALSTPKNAERTSLPIMQCKQSTPNSMGLNFDQSVSSPNQRTGDVLKRLADLMTQLRGSCCGYPNQKLSKEIFYIILHGGNPLTPLWIKEPTVHLSASITLEDIQPRSQGSNKRPSYLGKQECLPPS